MSNESKKNDLANVILYIKESNEKGKSVAVRWQNGWVYGEIMGGFIQEPITLTVVNANSLCQDLYDGLITEFGDEIKPEWSSTWEYFMSLENIFIFFPTDTKWGYQQMKKDSQSKPKIPAEQVYDTEKRVGFLTPFKHNEDYAFHKDVPSIIVPRRADDNRTVEELEQSINQMELAMFKEQLVFIDGLQELYKKCQDSQINTAMHIGDILDGNSYEKSAHTIFEEGLKKQTEYISELLKNPEYQNVKTMSPFSNPTDSADFTFNNSNETDLSGLIGMIKKAMEEEKSVDFAVRDYGDWFYGEFSGGEIEELFELNVIDSDNICQELYDTLESEFGEQLNNYGHANNSSGSREFWISIGENITFHFPNNLKYSSWVYQQVAKEQEKLKNLGRKV